MRIAKKNEVKSVPITVALPEQLYGIFDEYPSKEKGNIKEQFVHLIRILEKDANKLENDFTCLIEETAYNAFIAFANDVYKKTGNEACGVFVGYYLHHPDSENKKIIVATNFLEAHGRASRVTCEISFDDNIRFGNFCDAYNMFPVVWVHSHPGFGTFYSGTDSDTLRRVFRANHQMGIVVDILESNSTMGFKIKDGVERNENVYIFNLEQSLTKGELSYHSIYQIPSSEISLEIEKKNSNQTQSETKKGENIGRKEDNDKSDCPNSDVATKRDERIHMKQKSNMICRKILSVVEKYGIAFFLSIISVELFIIILLLLYGSRT